MAGTYYQAIAEGQRSGQAGRVVPSGSGRNITYRFVPSGGSRGGGSGGVPNQYTDFLADFQKREEGARTSNLARETEIRGTYDELINQDQGAFRTAGLADIERSKTQAVGAGTQQLISSGLYGTTTAAALPVQAEGQAARSRLKLEDIIQQRTNELKLGKAGFVERIDQPYPDYGLLVKAMAAQGQR
ncbi:hypothetical protein LCGC14_1040230 [marine sediment metagenome]|uniref:Uncharacterized protein n=1 Tax=marine sediment metagenome TaxID=412755 RepID=A0A0F9QA73_9ZZZZ